MKINGFLIIISGLTLLSCSLQPSVKTVHTFDDKAAHKSNDLSSNVPSESSANIKLSDHELQKYAYELGLDPRKNLTASEVQTIEERKKLRQLERSLDSQKERLNYSKVVPWLTSDQEKIEYLSIPSIEGRNAWVRKSKVWLRAKDNGQFKDMVEDQDIAIGMTSDLVKKAWGEPDNVEYSGNPIYKNERWKYHRQVPSQNGYHREKRLVFFEGGKVVGWETE